MLVFVTPTNEILFCWQSHMILFTTTMFVCCWLLFFFISPRAYECNMFFSSQLVHIPASRVPACHCFSTHKNDKKLKATNFLFFWITHSASLNLCTLIFIYTCCEINWNHWPNHIHPPKWNMWCDLWLFTYCTNRNKQMEICRLAVWLTSEATN